MIDIVPRHQLGYMVPVLVSDAIHHQFYQLMPSNCAFVCKPLDLKSFTREGALGAIDAFWPAFDFLVERGVDRISQGGIPVSAPVGRRRILTLLEEAARRSSIPTSADFAEAIDALRALGVRRVAVAAKWDDALMRAVSDYLADAGIETVGLTSEPHSASEVIAVRPRDGVDLALNLGRTAFRDAPKADGLLLAGGAWLSLQAVPQLEQEFGRPVVTNPSATFWAALRQFGEKGRMPGWGRLIDGLPAVPQDAKAPAK